MNSFLSKNRFCLTLGILIFLVLSATLAMALQVSVNGPEVYTSTSTKPTSPGGTRIGPGTQSVSMACSLTCTKPNATCEFSCSLKLTKCISSSQMMYLGCMNTTTLLYNDALAGCGQSFPGCSGDGETGDISCQNPASQPGYSQCVEDQIAIRDELFGSCASGNESRVAVCNGDYCPCVQGCCPVVVLP